MADLFLQPLDDTGYFCSQLCLRLYLQRRPRFPQPETIFTATQDEKNTLVTCIAFKKSPCTRSSCRKWHKFIMIRGKDYRGLVCRKLAASGKEATLGENLWHISVGDSVEKMDSAVSSLLMQFSANFCALLHPVYPKHAFTSPSSILLSRNYIRPFLFL